MSACEEPAFGPFYRVLVETGKPRCLEGISTKYKAPAEDQAFGQWWKWRERSQRLNTLLNEASPIDIAAMRWPMNDDIICTDGLHPLRPPEPEIIP